MPWRGQKQLPEADALLLHAYSLHKASLCPCGCGNPAEIALDPAAMGSAEVDADKKCAYRAALEQWRDQQAKQTEPTYGVLPVPVLDEKSYRITKARIEMRDRG